MEYLKLIDQYIMNFMFDNLEFFFILSTILVVSLKNYSKKNIQVAAVTYLVGTFFHELSHYVAGLVTTFKFPERISILPEKETEGNKSWYVLGYVQIKSRYLNFVNSFIIGFAPLSLMYISYVFYKYFLIYYEKYYELNSLVIIFYVFIIVTLFISSIPSKADFKMSMIKGSLFMWLLLITLLIYFWEYIDEVYILYFFIGLIFISTLLNTKDFIQTIKRGSIILIASYLLISYIYGESLYEIYKNFINNISF